jgi:hypothetical protein
MHVKVVVSEFWHLLQVESLNVGIADRSLYKDAIHAFAMQN